MSFVIYVMWLVKYTQRNIMKLDSDCWGSHLRQCWGNYFFQRVSLPPIVVHKRQVAQKSSIAYHFQIS